MSKSNAEKFLELQLIESGIGYEREVRFHPTRRWRFDFCIKKHMIAIEVEGITSYGRNKNGTMRLGRHQTAKGMREDLEKYDNAMRLGWNVYRCSQDMVMNGTAIETIKVLKKLSSNRRFESGFYKS